MRVLKTLKKQMFSKRKMKVTVINLSTLEIYDYDRFRYVFPIFT